MEFYPLKVNLSKETHMDDGDQYFLHAVTFCDRSNFIADGYSLLPNALNETGHFQINLYLAKDMETEDLRIETPVSHVIPLGSLPSNGVGSNINIKINVLERERGDDKPKGTVTISSAGANETSREY